MTHNNPSMDISARAGDTNCGIGVVIPQIPLMTAKMHIASESRPLIPAERNYSQIEKEILAIVFAIKQFHKMLYRRHFTASTGHKPLVIIFRSKKRHLGVYS